MTITSNIMENMHGVDVSWIHNASNKGTLCPSIGCGVVAS